MESEDGCVEFQSSGGKVAIKIGSSALHYCSSYEGI